MNNLGKGLVLVHLAISILVLTWAAAVFLQFTDFGWKEPRQELDFRLPSEFDVRSAAFEHAIRSRNSVYPNIAPLYSTLREAQDRYPEDHLWYEQELKRLKSDPGELIIKEIKYNGGELVLDTPGKKIGKPVLETPIDGLKKSEAAYLEDLKVIGKETETVTKDTGVWLGKTKDITLNLTGLDETGKKTRLGLYDLLEHENKLQAQLKFEMEYLKPRWVDAVKEAELFRERKTLLEQALKRVRKPRP